MIKIWDPSFIFFLKENLFALLFHVYFELTTTLAHLDYARFDFVKKMINVFPDLNIRWLLSGEGIMTYNETGVEKNRDYSRNIEKVIIFYDDNSFDELKS